jgi:hypothetical protein
MFWDIPHEQIVRLETTRQPEKTMALVAPASGIVVEKNVLRRQCHGGHKLYKIADLSTVWVAADVYEYEVPFVKVGQHATVTLAYVPGKIFHGRVAYVYPQSIPIPGTVRVRVELPNRDGSLKPDMFATVEIESRFQSSVAIPEEAVIHSGERNVVVVSRGGGRFESHDVALGVLADRYYQVLSGVNAGDSIVVSSQFLIDSESNLKAALKQMTPDPASGYSSRSSNSPVRRRLTAKRWKGWKVWRKRSRSTTQNTESEATMLGRIIEWSVRNKFLVILVTAFAIGGGIWAIQTTPVDAIPDLSDVQVIVYTKFSGQSPRTVEDQITYPLTTQLVSVPFSKVVRGYSFFGYSLIYIIFEDGTDLYWARSRVLEYLNYARTRLP